MGANINGLGGSFGVSGLDYLLDIASWSGDVTIETVEVTSFDAKEAGGDVGFQQHIPVMGSLSGSASGFIEGGSVKPVPAALLSSGAFATGHCQGTITLTAAANNTWAFAGVITGVSLAMGVGEAGTGTYSFESSGTITQTWST